MAGFLADVGDIAGGAGERDPAGQGFFANRQAPPGVVIAALGAAVKFLVFHQIDRAPRGAEIVAHNQQHVVEDSVSVQAGENHLGGLLQDSHLPDTGVDLGHRGSPQGKF